MSSTLHNGIDMTELQYKVQFSWEKKSLDDLVFLTQKPRCYIRIITTSLRLDINQPVMYCTLNSPIAVYYEMRSRCDVSSRPNQMSTMGCDWRNSNFSVFMLWSVQPGVFSQLVRSGGCRHVHTGPEIQMYPLRQRAFTLQVSLPHYWWPTISTKTDVKYRNTPICFIDCPGCMEVVKYI